jgi:adenosylhomocysteine nucleosidase
MQHELDPLVQRLDMTADGLLHRGRVGDVEVVALLTSIGMAAGARAARDALELGVERVVVVGIAGGVDRSVAIGDVVVPEVVVERATGRAFTPSFIGGLGPRGTLSCGDDLIIDPDTLDAMAADGVVAVDMETAAVAAVCEEAGCSWSVFRGISDYAGEGLVDEALFALTRPDGTADPDDVTRYLEEHPDRVAVLARLASDMTVATHAAAEAAIAACADL